MIDAYGRQIDYMRISITDRCNLRCGYCMPKGVTPLRHEEILRYEEILHICRIAIKIGIKNFKVTGGEPLVRKGCVDFLRELKSLPGVGHVSLTTNAVLLNDFIEDICDIGHDDFGGLDGINISLDSLRPDIYHQITGSDQFSKVWRALVCAVEAGLRVKLNCVPMDGQNNEDILPMAQLTEKMPVDVRFIEFMPTGAVFKSIPGSEIINMLQTIYPDLAEETTKRGFGPARYFKSSKMQGAIGIIDAMENCFCHTCNRLRLTSTGFLKLCLFHDDGLDLRTLIRSGATDSDIKSAICREILNKPKHYMRDEIIKHDGICKRNHIKNMSQIGG